MSQQAPDWKAIREKAGPYPLQAYQFVRDGLGHTVSLVHGAGAGVGGGAGAGASSGGGGRDEDSRHVSGQQLCRGLKDFAIKQYGLLARTVLSRWGITTTEDFGRIVFAMIEAGLMRKTEDDTLEDFREVFDFDEAFGDLPVGKA